MTADPGTTLPADPPLLASPGDAIRALGFDPDLVQVVILTPTSVVAIAADYPEPYVPPEA